MPLPAATPRYKKLMQVSKLTVAQVHAEYMHAITLTNVPVDQEEYLT